MAGGQGADINPGLMLHEGLNAAHSVQPHIKAARRGCSLNSVSYRQQTYGTAELNEVRDKLLIACQDLLGNATVYASEPLMDRSRAGTIEDVQYDVHESSL